MRVSYLLALGAIAMTVFASCGGSSSDGRSDVGPTTVEATSVVAATGSSTAGDATAVVGATVSPTVVGASSSPAPDDTRTGVDDCERLRAESLTFADELGVGVGLYMDESPDLPSCRTSQPEPWPEDYTILVNDEVEVRFPYNSYGSRLSNIYITHIASNTYISVDSEGHVGSIRGEPSDDALSSVCEVLADETLMSGVYARAHELYPYLVSHMVVPNPCDRAVPPFVTGTPTTLTPSELEAWYEQRRFKGEDEWPEGYRLGVNKEVEIRFAYPLGNNKVQGYPMHVRHIPTSNRAWVNLDGRVVLTNVEMGPDDLRAICAVLADESLMDGVIARAIEIGVFWVDRGAMEPDPCATSPEP